ncbi:hypothetical protein R1flu_022256 [Riccia fluitans]|uniref:Uncharacterized protein n=1 Tax=Riccia fluitans TaxID=41844 RepID=A0ABD1ZRQ8_9MARC
MHEIIFRQIKDAKILLTIDEITALSPVSKEFEVNRLAGELVPQQRLISALSKSEPTRAESGTSSTSGATPSEGSPVDVRAVRACYVSPMIPVRIGDITFPRVLVDTGSGVNVMSNQIRIRLGYHRMAPPTTKLAMADNTLKGARAIIDMDEEVIHIRAGTNLTTVKWFGVATPGTVQVQQAQPMEWDFAGGFTNEDEDQFLNDQPYIVLVAEVNLVPLTDEEKHKELRKYLKSIKRKMKLGAPPQVPTYPEEMNFREDQFGILATPRQIDETPAEQAV